MNVFIKKNPKPNQEKEATLWDFGSWCWKDQTVKFHSMLFLPFHRLCILLLRPLSLQTDGETDNFGKIKACSLVPHKPSASFCMCVPQGFLIFPYIGHRPDLCIKQIIQYWWFSVVYTILYNSLLSWITWVYKAFRGSASMNTTKEYETSFDQLSYIVINL